MRQLVGLGLDVLLDQVVLALVGQDDVRLARAKAADVGAFFVLGWVGVGCVMGRRGQTPRRPSARRLARSLLSLSSLLLCITSTFAQEQLLLSEYHSSKIILREELLYA